MKMKTRKIEVYIGYANYTWNTMILDIPFDTPEDKIRAATEKIGAEVL